MTFHLFSNVVFEQWDWRNSVEQGIGGCETSQTEMSRHLAARGHEVYSYTDIPDDCPREWEGTHWRHINEVDFSKPGVWMIYRSPELVDGFDLSRTDQVRWLCCQDWLYDVLTPERAMKFDRIIPMCHDHEYFMWKHQPWTKGKTWVTRNGIKNQLIEEVEAAGPVKRAKHRMMYASSPDRGLKSSLLVFQKVKEYLPDAELHCTYGFNNIDKLIAQGAMHFKKDKDECLKLVEKTGATFHGRLSQRQLYNEWRRTNCLIYITSFYETGWITGLEAMALGAIPVYSPIHAQGENAKGVMVIGRPDDPMTIARAAGEVVRVMKDEEGQEAMRQEIMAHTRANWGWEQFAWKKPGENWEQAAEEDLAKKKPKARWTTFPETADPGNFDAEESSRQRWLHLKPGDVFLDLGANKGSWSSPALEMGATVVAVDPNEAMVDGLLSHAKAQGWSDRLFVWPVAIGFGGDPEGARTIDELHLHDEGESGAKFYFRDDKPTRLDFIKIDIEGCELLALKGGVELLKKFKPRMMIEVHTNATARKVSVQEVTDFLDSLQLGYVYEAVDHEDGWYTHLYCHVPAFQLAAGLCDNADEVETRARWLHLDTNDVMLDVGAADGAWTIAAAKQGATVYAIDPAAKFTKLDAQVEAAGQEIEDRVHVVEAYASDRNGEKVEVEGGRTRVMVPGLTLDTLSISEDLTNGSSVTFVKIDVEGLEMNVLRGATGILMRDKPDLMVEVHIETVRDKRVSVEEVEKFIKGTCQEYRFERKMLTYQGKSYCHLFATVRPEC